MNLLDTDIIIELLRKKKHEAEAISAITLIEMLRGLNADKRAKIKELLEESFHVHALDNRVIEAYCHLYQKLKDEGASIPDADLLIAATAISAETALESRDEHFGRLKPLGLTLKPHP